MKPVIDAQASVWNVNAYHWETRKLEGKATEWLTNELNKAGFNNVKVSGEAEMSIRKGKKIIVFELHITTDEFAISEFTNSDESKIVWKNQKNEAELRKLLAGLEEELKKY